MPPGITVAVVERAIRAHLSGGSKLYTISRSSPFLLAKIDADGIVLKLAMRWATRLPWECLEGTGALPAREAGFAPEGSTALRVSPARSTST